MYGPDYEQRLKLAQSSAKDAALRLKLPYDIKLALLSAVRHTSDADTAIANKIAEAYVSGLVEVRDKESIDLVGLHTYPAVLLEKAQSVIGFSYGLEFRKPGTRLQSSLLGPEAQEPLLKGYRLGVAFAAFDVAGLTDVRKQEIPADDQQWNSFAEGYNRALLGSDSEYATDQVAKFGRRLALRAMESVIRGQRPHFPLQIIDINLLGENVDLGDRKIYRSDAKSTEHGYRSPISHSTNRTKFIFNKDLDPNRFKFKS